MKVRLRITGQVQPGKAKTANPNYAIWCEIKRRCNDSSRHNYKYYGGRGIKVCNRWLNSFDNFNKDMGERPNKFEIDRIDNNKNYSPDNCRWVSHRENTLNRNAYGVSGIKNVRFNKGRYEAGLRRFGKYIYLGRYTNLELAVLAVRNYEN